MTVQVSDLTVEGTTLARVAAAARMPDITPAERHAVALRYALVSPTTNLVLVYERPDTEKPDHMPALQQVAHALPAGWGGVGSATKGTFTSPASPTLRASRHSGSNTGPAVWRREQTSAMFRAAQKTNDTYDIPAFLRKQVPVDEYAHRDELRRFVEAMAPTTATGHAAMPTSLDEIGVRLPAHVSEALQQLVEAGYAEQDVIEAFIVSLARQFRHESFAQRVLDAIRRLVAGARSTSARLERHVERIVQQAFHARTGDAPGDILAWLRNAAD